MSKNPFRRATDKREELDAAEAELEHYKAQADAREPRVNALWSWAMSRRISNGVGHDFEWTLSNPRPMRG